MDIQKIIKIMSDPNFYGKNIKKIDIIETHISYVFLTGLYAFKIKKPVNFGFLDFSTLDKRKYYIYQELLLNKRLCPEIYIDVLPITKKGDSLELDGTGKIIEYALKMREFPQKQILKNILKNNNIGKCVFKKINNKLIKFYNTNKTDKEINSYGEPDKIKKNIIENFEQTEKYIDISISNNSFNFIKDNVYKFLELKKNIFDDRIFQNKINDCHGDLHTGNMVFQDNDIYIFDCIEFNKRFRYCDIASDLAFLSMDLDYLNHPYLSSFFIKYYINKTKDYDILKLLNFYKSYRAYVRGKVISFNLNDKLENNIFNSFKKEAEKYFELSEYYTSLLEIDLIKKKPILIIVFGLTGTGKSTLSSKLSVDYNADLINTDIVRKKIAGIDLYERHHDEFNTGLYSEEKQNETYLKVLEKAEESLLLKNNVIIDATFQRKKYRDLVKKLAEKFGIEIIFIKCNSPDHIVKKWLNQRIKSNSISDGRWEIYESQKITFEKVVNLDNYIEIDMSKNSYNHRLNYYKEILNIVKGVI